MLSWPLMLAPDEPIGGIGWQEKRLSSAISFLCAARLSFHFLLDPVNDGLNFAAVHEAFPQSYQSVLGCSGVQIYFPPRQIFDAS
jgi:hypothetical protein